MNVIDLVSQNSNLLSWQQGLQKNNRELILGLSATTKAIVMASAFDSIEKAVLITSSYNEAERLASDFIALLGEEKVHTFLGDDNPLAEFVFASQERQFARLEALNFLCQEDRQGILVTNVSGIKLLLPSPKVFASSIFQLKVGQEIDLTTLSETLQKIGYQKVSQVLQQGEFSLRGDILDIFEIDQLQPYRIEFFGDEIDGIRIFDPESQRSVENVEEVQLKAVSDLLLQEEDFIRGQQQIEQLQEQSANEEFKSYLAEILGDISQRNIVTLALPTLFTFTFAKLFSVEIILATELSDDVKVISFTSLFVSTEIVKVSPTFLQYSFVDILICVLFSTL